MVPAGLSVLSLIETEMETLTMLLVDRRRKRVVPVDAASAVGTVVIALVEVLETMVVMVPEQAPVDSVQVPEQRCMVMVSGEMDVKVCWIPNEMSALV